MTFTEYIMDIHNDSPYENVITQGCTEQQITEAEQQLNVTFPESYKEYLRKIGQLTMILDDGEKTGLTGLNTSDEYDVVKVTTAERLINPYFPDDMFIIHDRENRLQKCKLHQMLTDKKINSVDILNGYTSKQAVDKLGCVYNISYAIIERISDSLDDYHQWLFGA